MSLSGIRVITVKADQPFDLDDGEEVLNCVTEHRGQWGCFYRLTILRQLSRPITAAEPVTLPRLDYARLMHLAYAGAEYLSIPNGQTDVEPL